MVFDCFITNDFIWMFCVLVGERRVVDPAHVPRCVFCESLLVEEVTLELYLATQVGSLYRSELCVLDWIM